MNLICSSCRKNLDVGDKIGFRDLCPHCSAYLHSCVHCRFYVKEQCIEPAAEKVRDPEGGNYCDFFQAREVKVEIEDVSNAKSEAEDLWKKLTGKS
jgi:hypothetical protein